MALPPTLPIAAPTAEPLITTISSAASSDSTRANSPVDEIKNGSGGESHVDVKSAEGEFEALRRQLTTTSSLHRTATHQKDEEKEGGAAGEDDFDLLEYMTDSAQTRSAHGFQQKQVGVIWDKLSVTGAGGMKVRFSRDRRALRVV